MSRPTTLRPALAMAAPLAMAMTLAACGSARRSEPIIGPIPLHGEAESGQIVFMRHCNGCHPHGEAGVGPALNNKPLPGEAIKLQVRTGLVGGSMPPFPPEKISDDELSALVAYLGAIRKL